MANKFWDEAEGLIKAAGLKPKDFKKSSNWNKKSDVKDLKKQLKIGKTKGSDDSTFRDIHGNIQEKTAENRELFEEKQSASEQLANWKDVGVSGGWFGTDDLAQVRGWGGEQNVKDWVSGGDHRGLGKVTAIGRGVAADLWGYTDPGDKNAFGRKDIEELQNKGASQAAIQKIMEGFNRRGAQVGEFAKTWSGQAAAKDKGELGVSTDLDDVENVQKAEGAVSQDSTGVDKDAPPEVDLSIGPYTASSMKSGGAGAGGVAFRTSPNRKLQQYGQGTKQLSRQYKNLSINIGP